MGGGLTRRVVSCCDGTQYEQDGSEFSSVDYMAETPHWALKGAVEEGFDPSDSRHHRNKNGKPVEFPYKPSDSGCG